MLLSKNAESYCLAAGEILNGPRPLTNTQLTAVLSLMVATLTEVITALQASNKIDVQRQHK